MIFDDDVVNMSMISDRARLANESFKLEEKFAKHDHFDPAAGFSLLPGNSPELNPQGGANKPQ